MKRTVLLLLCTAYFLILNGCYIYTDEPLPHPVIIVPANSGGGVPAPAPPQDHPAPSGPPAGAVGPPQG